MAAEERDEPGVDRARRDHGQLLADDRAHEGAVVVAGRGPGRIAPRLGRPLLVEQAREHRVRGAQVIERGAGGRAGRHVRPATAGIGSPSSALSARSSDTRRHVKLGVSRSVYADASVPRSSCTRSRNAPTSSVSNATTNSWSSRPNEYVVWLSTCGYWRPILMWFCITR